MKVTLSWLKEFVDTALPVQEIANALTMAGLEVESVEKIARPFSGIVIGKILSCERHPQADKLQICHVDAGRGEPLMVVCGAPNAADGMLAPLALPGAILGPDMNVELREIRGVKSSGMLCSEAELGLTERGEGLMVLDKAAEPGQDFSAWMGEDDYIIDVFITPNRPDCLSVIGLAREIAAVTGSAFTVKPVKLSQKNNSLPAKIAVEIQAPGLCPRYSGRYLENIRIQPSPFWMAYRLYHAGLRAINNIVDITNYVMLETGHPLHAFDAPRIDGQRIVVRASLDKESFTTLDGKSYTLDSETCLICDDQKAIALAGIMGGLNSEVQSTTACVFLESAYFEPTAVRKASKRLGISTESSRRFERGANPNGTLNALDRAAELITELAGAFAAGDVVDAYPRVIDPATIRLALAHVNSLIGTGLQAAEVVQILNRLEIACQDDGSGVFVCTVPTFRPDLTRPIDLIEEISRIYGFDRIPFAQTAALDQAQAVNPRVAFQDQIRRLLAGFGLRETLSLSLVPPAAGKLFLPDHSGLVELLNPLSVEWSAFRTSLLISLLNNAAYNRNRQMPNLRFFEIGNAAWKQEHDFVEKKQVAGLLVGEAQAPAWHEKAKPVDFYDIKGIVLALLNALGIKNLALGAAPAAFWGQESAGVYLNDAIFLGAFGRIEEELLQVFKIKTPDVFGFLLDFDLLFENRLQHRKFTAIPKFPLVPFDLALLMDVNMPVGEVEKAILEAGGPNLINVRLFDYYQGEQVPQGKKSVAFSLNFCSKERTLGVEEVDGHIAEILAHLAERFAVELRPR